MRRLCALVFMVPLLSGASPAWSQPKAYATATDINRDRGIIAAQLVEPIARCVMRHDTNHVIFHGCVDWHSSVHGMLGLVLFGGLSGDARFDSFIEKQLAEPELARERAMLQRNPGFEMPYGRAWFLRLAVEYERRFASQKLRAMADDVAESLKNFIAPRRSDLFEGAYDSISWALINLIDYAQATNNRVLLDFANDYARTALLRAGPRCSYQLEHAEFMSICLQRAWLASKVLTALEFETWNGDFLKTVGIPQPIMQPTSAHHHGLNFSRSWALAALARKDGGAAYDAAFATHFGAGYQPRTNWDGEYQIVAHWVAQFGMMALRILSADAPRP